MVMYYSIKYIKILLLLDKLFEISLLLYLIENKFYALRVTNMSDSTVSIINSFMTESLSYRNHVIETFIMKELKRSLRT